MLAQACSEQRAPLPPPAQCDDQPCPSPSEQKRTSIMSEIIVEERFAFGARPCERRPMLTQLHHRALTARCWLPPRQGRTIGIAGFYEIAPVRHHSGGHCLIRWRESALRRSGQRA